jgi:hypothetical protein
MQDPENHMSVLPKTPGKDDYVDLDWPLIGLTPGNSWTALEAWVASFAISTSEGTVLSSHTWFVVKFGNRKGD